jgi:outer membrane protein assembly factor BamA
MVVVLACTPVAAQDDPEYGERDGRGALLFMFDELNLNAFGGGFGCRYWLTDLWAMNASLRFRGENRTTDESGSATSEYSQASVGFSTTIERHLLRARLSPYVGAGIGYLYTYRKNSRANPGYSAEDRTDIHEGSVSLDLGAEFWLNRNFSLSGQYSLHFGYMNSKSRRGSSTSTTPRETTTDQWRSSVGAGSLALAVYF